MSHCSQCSKLIRGVCRFCHPQEYIDMVQQAMMDLAKEPLLKRQWIGLTDKERSKIWGELPSTRNEERDAIVFAEAIEIYLKEKNT